MCREGLTVVTLLHWHMHLAIQLANLVNVQTVDLFHVWSLSHGSWYCNSIDQDSLGAAAHLRPKPSSVITSQGSRLAPRLRRRLTEPVLEPDRADARVLPGRQRPIGEHAAEVARVDVRH